MEHQIASNQIFAYRRKEKLRSAILTTTTAIALPMILLVGVYATLYQLQQLPQPISTVLEWLHNSIEKGSPPGIILAAFASALFFMVSNIEVVYTLFISKGIPFTILYPSFLLGIVMAQSLNYQIGYWFSGATRSLIPVKKFYQMKGILNHYGSKGILIIYLLPLPSPILSAVLGAFRYNRLRYQILMLLGQAILLGWIYILLQFFPLQRVEKNAHTTFTLSTVGFFKEMDSYDQNSQ